MQHIPVLLNEIVENLTLQPGDNVIDATFGGGGYSSVLAKLVGEKGSVLGIDADISAVANAAKAKDLPSNIKVAQGNFKNISRIANSQGIKQADAIVFDLGLSSKALDNPIRGFSFQLNGPLDMRFNEKEGITAAEIVNRFEEKDLVKTFKDYGEEKLSGRIAKEIVKARSKKKIETTGDLRRIIEIAVPGKFKKFLVKTNSRIFQALRIAVNQEMESLKEALPSAFNLLNDNGKLAVVSYHSLEDRIVKQYFASLIKGCTCPSDFPVCVCGKKSLARAVTKKPIIPSHSEIAANPRARSAKLRVIAKWIS